MRFVARGQLVECFMREADLERGRDVCRISRNEVECEIQSKSDQDVKYSGGRLRTTAVASRANNLLEFAH